MAQLLTGSYYVDPGPIDAHIWHHLLFYELLQGVPAQNPNTRVAVGPTILPKPCDASSPTRCGALPYPTLNPRRHT